MAPDMPSRAPRRLGVFVVVLTLAFAAMGTRLFMLQILQAPALAERALSQREVKVEFHARRGAIFDRSGEPLAISIDLYTVFADPSQVENPERSAAKLAPLLGENEGKLAKALRGSLPGSLFEYLARQVRPGVARRVEKLELPGVHVRVEPKRYYPGGRLASHVLGFVDIDGQGIAGIESQFETMLEGEPGRMVSERDPSGTSLPQADFSYTRAKPGASLFLSIDKELQYFTELTLARAVKAYGADAATAIVMRPDTGEILALANLPDYNPNDPGDSSLEAQRNRALTDVYEPGSVFKIVTAAAALEEGTVRPDSPYVVPDAMQVSDRVFHDSHSHPTEEMTFTEIIEQSSNVGTIKVGLELGPERLLSYIDKFGFGHETGLDFPGESAGIILPLDQWSGTTPATVPIGQGIAVTPLQMLGAMGAIANDGVWVEPKLVTSSMGERGRLRDSSDPGSHRVVSTKTARTLQEILRGVVDRGTGVEAQIPGFEVGGKTGTAQKPLPEGGYGDAHIATFAGFAPVKNPEVVAIVVLDEPEPIWGGATAAPTFKTIVEFALRRVGAAPSEDVEKAAREIEDARATRPLD